MSTVIVWDKRQTELESDQTRVPNTTLLFTKIL